MRAARPVQEEPRSPRCPGPQPPAVMPPRRNAMRIRQVVVVFVVAAASTLAGSGVASACKLCDPFLHCITQAPGALTCVEGPASCAMFLQCVGGGRKVPDGGPEYLTTWSLFDAPMGSALPSAPASLRSEVGDITLGDEARATSGAAVGTLAD